MNALLTGPVFVDLPLWGLVYFGMDFQELVFPNLGSLAWVTAKD